LARGDSAVGTRPAGTARPVLERPALLLFTAALVARLIYLGELHRSPLWSPLIGDGAAYDAWARRLAAGDWLGGEVFYQAPLYPYLLGALYRLAGADPLWPRLLQSLLGAASCLVLAAAGRRFLGAGAGLAAGWLLALYPPALFFDGEIQKASLSLAFMCALLWLLAGLRRRPRLAAGAATGVVVGAFALNRENALLLAPLLAAWLLATPDETWRRRLAAGGLLVAGCLATLLPVALRNRAIGGELVLTTAQLGPNFYIGNHAGADGRYRPLVPGRGSPRYEREDATRLAEAALGRRLSPAEVSRYWLGEALRFARREPGRWLALVLRKWFLVWNAREIVDTTSLEAAADHSRLLRGMGSIYHFGVLCPLAVAGLWLTRRRWRELSVLYLVLLAWALSVTAFFVFARYRYPMVPVLLLFAGAAAERLADAVRRRRAAGLTAAACLGLAAALLVNWPADDRDPRAPTYASLGRALADAGRLAEAQRALERTVALSPRFAGAHLALADVRLRRDDLDAAEASYRRVLELDASSPAAWNNLGTIAGRRGRAAEAIALYRRALEADGDDVAALSNLGHALLAGGDLGGARGAFERLVTTDPEDAGAHHQLANLLAWSGDRERSRDHYQRALALAPGNADAHFKLALIEDSRGDAAACRRHLGRAIALSPGYAGRLRDFARAHSEAGRRPEAERLYRHLLAVAPGDTATLEALERLRVVP
jgi:tetratricopeptide (TPR) repeat protein